MILEERQRRVRRFTRGGIGKEADRAGDEERQHDAEHKAPVADAVRDERFLRGVACFLSIEVVTNQQVRAETHAFPADKHQHEVVREHERQHREHEQVQKCEEAIEARFAVHVADGEDVNQEADERDEERVGAAQAIHREREVGAESADLQPRPDVIEHRRLQYAARRLI